jgi:hypothetical protein
VESRNTRKALRSFPVDLALTQDPTDQLRKFLDITGRQTTLLGEYTQDQLDNIFAETADPNEPSYLYLSGQYIPQDADLSGYWVEDVQDLVTMAVTGFDLEEVVYPSGLPDEDIVGISFAEDPLSSGYVYMTVDGYREVYRYTWKNLETSPEIEGTFAKHQSYEDTGTDEYLVIQQDAALGTIAELKHEPLGLVTLVDAKNMAAPWTPDTSDGIEVEQSEIVVSGKYLILETPRHSYSPMTVDAAGNESYPTDYQPDQYWKSSFIAEYDYYTEEAPYGICQPTNRHNLGLVGMPLSAAKDLE